MSLRPGSGGPAARVVGLDVGGANLKAADGAGGAAQLPFPLWQAPEALPERLATLLSRFPQADIVAVAMTGELCDCFPTKAAGVRHIAEACRIAAPQARILVWTVEGRFAELPEILEHPAPAAAANWLALAAWAAAQVGDGLLCDIGSTTADFVPLRVGRPAPTADNDRDRLAAGELVYVGLLRTPLCALLPELRLAGRRQPTMAEVFATTQDAYLWRGEVAEEPERTDTADRRPATRAFALARLARMVGADSDSFTPAEADELAAAVAAAVQAKLLAAARQVADAQGWDCPPRWVLSGAGEFVGAALAAALPGGQPPWRVAEALGPAVSASAAAHAVAWLARRLASA